jgi:glycosyltransferase involved in cell wall biosynthesis
LNPGEITVVILTRNEERNLPRALHSIPRETPVLVVDARSTDATVEIAEFAGAAVITRPWEGFLRARLFALTQVRTPWVFMLDADEEMTPELRTSLRNCDGSADAYRVMRRTLFLERPLRQWSRERLIRLFRPERVQLHAAPATGGEAELHEHWVTDGTVGSLRGLLIHHSYPTIAAYHEKYERYTEIEAQGVRATRLRYGYLIARGFVHFLWIALRRGALLDGWRGLYVAWHSAFYPAAVARKALPAASPA